MIESNFLNSFSKEFPKEVNELKLLISIHNDIRNNFSVMKNSVDLETKHLEILYKNIVLTSKSFMSEISSIQEIDNLSMNSNFTFSINNPNNQNNPNNLDNSNFVNISMGLGNLFDIIGKIFFDEVEYFKSKINENFINFNQELNLFNSYFVENTNLTLKDFSMWRNKNKSSQQKLEKLFRELENIINSFTNKKEKFSTNEKNILLYSDFEESSIQFQILQDEVKKVEIFTEENMNNLFLNSLKITIDSLNYFKDNFNLISDFKLNLVIKIQKALSITLEGMTVENLIYQNNSQNPFENKEIELTNLYDFSENFLNYLQNNSTNLNFKKRLVQSVNKFMNEILKHKDNLLTQLQKNQKTIFNNKNDKSYSYINLTSVSQLFDFLRSSFELTIKKFEEFYKITNNNILNQSESYYKEILNEENFNQNNLYKFNKELQTYKQNLNKLLISKEKIINQIVNRKMSDDKTEGKIKNEENLINDQIIELNNKFRNYVLEFVKNYYNTLNSNISPKFKLQEIIINFISQLEKAYSSLKDYLKIKDHFDIDRKEENNYLKNNNLEDIKIIYEVFIKEYLSDNFIQNETVESFMNEKFNQVLILFKEDINYNNVNENSDNELINLEYSESYKLSLPSNEILLSEEYEKIGSDFIEINLKTELNTNSINTDNPFQNVYNFIYLNKNDLITSIYFSNFEKQLKEEINLIKEKTNLFKLIKTRKNSNSNSVSSDLNIIKLQFNLDSDDAIQEKINCSLIEKQICIQGIIFITNKKIVFNSKFNNNNKSLIEINKEDLTRIKRYKYSNDILLINTKLTELEELKFLYRNSIILEKFLNIIKQNFKIENMNKINLNNNINDEIVIMDHYIQENNIENKRTSSNNIEDFVINEMSVDFCNNIINMNLKEENNISENISEILNEINLFERLNEFHKIRLEYFDNNNIIRKDFTGNFVNTKSILPDNNLDLPIFLIFNNIYDYENLCVYKDLDFKKNFELSLKEINKDYNINFNYIREDYKSTIPEYYSDPNYTLNLFTKFNKTDLEEFLNNLNKNFNENSMLEYEYKYTHPMKKKFMGPSKLDLHDYYKIYFISPLSFIVEVKTLLAGFMLMDTFFTIAQYKYETEMNYDNNLKRICYKTTVTSNFTIEFVKDNWFKNKIETDGMIDNEIYIKNFILNNIGKVLFEKLKEFREEEKKFFLLINKSKIIENKIIVENDNNIIEDNNNYEIVINDDNNKQNFLEEKNYFRNEDDLNGFQIINSNSVNENIQNKNEDNYLYSSIDNNFYHILFIILPILISISFATKELFGDFVKDIIIYSLLTVIIYYLYKLMNQVKNLNEKVEKLAQP